MSVEVKINYAQITSRMKAKGENAAKAVAEQIVHDSRPFVPKQEGTLRDMGHVEADENGAASVWDGPYAAFQWYGCWPDSSHKVRNHTEPGTTTQWVYTAKRKYGDDWEKVAQNAKEKM